MLEAIPPDVRADLVFRARAKGVSGRQREILNLLAERPWFTGELWKRWECARRDVGRALDRLTDRGLVASVSIQSVTYYGLPINRRYHYLANWPPERLWPALAEAAAEAEAAGWWLQWAGHAGQHKQVALNSPRRYLPYPPLAEWLGALLATRGRYTLRASASGPSPARPLPPGVTAQLPAGAIPPRPPDSVHQRVLEYLEALCPEVSDPPGYLDGWEREIEPATEPAPLTVSLALTLPADSTESHPSRIP